MSKSDLIVKLTVDISDFTRYIVETGRRMLVLDTTLEVIGLTPDQVWSKFYVRGAMDPDFDEPDSVDNYLKVLGRIRGDRGHAARAGFLHGWATRWTP